MKQSTRKMNRGALLLSILLLLCGSLAVVEAQCYSSDYVEIASVMHQGEKYQLVTMTRKGDRIKAKYFAARDFNGANIYSRYLNWKSQNPKVVLYTSGTYTDNSSRPQGLTIDGGTMVNQSLIRDRMDALVVIYATGGIAVSDLAAGDLTISGQTRKLDIRKSAFDLDMFIQWAKSNSATVFQTHLLAYKNQLRVDPFNSSKDERERRFLAVGKGEDGSIQHVIVHYPRFATLYTAASKVLDFLNEFKGMEVTFMINLDTGMQDVFELHNADCTVNTTIKGQRPVQDAVNLLVYYFN